MNSSDAATNSPPLLATLLSRSLVAIALIAQIVVAWRYWPLTWDDSAITLGFSRAFALGGRIEPTPGSGIVEGYSTTLWMLLMALAAKLATSASALLAIAKISSLLLNLANILLIRRWFITWTPEVCANLIAGSVGCGVMFYETINGMETPLILTLVMVMLLFLPSTKFAGRVCYLFAGVAFLLTRWEALWLLVPLILVERPIRRGFTTAATWLAAFILSNYVRWLYFGSILPNTIIAKSHVPYTKPHHGLDLLVTHFTEPFSILASCGLMILILAISLGYTQWISKDRDPVEPARLRTLLRSWQLRFTILFTLFSFVLCTVIGTNLGPAFRAFYSSWPFLFCLLILPLASKLRGHAVTWATAALCFCALLRMSGQIREMNLPTAPPYASGATIKNVSAAEASLERIQEASHRQEMLFAGPDMGAVMLFSHGVRVLDLGLLCDPVLSRQGYGAINSYVLEQRRPEAIEVHLNWTRLTGFHRLPLFRQEYRPVYIDGKRMFLRRDVIATIDPARLIERPFQANGLPQPSDLPPDSTHYGADDYVLNQDFGSYLDLN